MNILDTLKNWCGNYRATSAYLAAWLVTPCVFHYGIGGTLGIALAISWFSSFLICPLAYACCQEMDHECSIDQKQSFDCTSTQKHHDLDLCDTFKKISTLPVRCVNKPNEIKNFGELVNDLGMSCEQCRRSEDAAFKALQFLKTELELGRLEFVT
jgi:hypothetical protein